MSILETFYFIFKGDASEVKKTSDDAKKTVQDAANSIEKSLTNVVKKFGGAIAAAVSIGAVIQGVRAAAEYAASLDMVSKSLGVSVEVLDVWGRAVEKSGGSAEGFQATVKSMNETIADIVKTGTGTALPFFQKLGIGLKDGEGRTKSFMSILPELADAFEGLSKTESGMLGKKLGLDEGTIALLQKGRKEVDAMIARQKELGVVTKQDAEIAAKFNLQWQDTTHAFNSLFVTIGSMILPAITSVSKAFETTALYFKRHGYLVEGVLIAIGAALTAIAIKTVIAFAPFFIIGGIIAAIGAIIAFVYDDIMHFLDGTDSLIGLLLESLPEIGELFKWLGSLWDGIFEKIKKGVELITGLWDTVKSFFGGSDVKVTGAIQSGQQAIANASNSPIGAQTTNSILANNTASKNTNVQIDKVTIETQADNPIDIANAFSNGLQTQMRQAVGNFDDGVAA